MSHFSSNNRVQSRRKDALKRREKDLEDLISLEEKKNPKYKGEKITKKQLGDKKKKAEEDIENIKEKL